MLAAALLAPRPAAAERLQIDWPLVGAAALLASGGWTVSEALKDRLARAACRWCARSDGDDAIGFAVPYFLHRAKPADSGRDLALSPMPNGASLALVF